MRVSLRWLRDYVDVPVPAHELARRLTMAGIEVEAIHAIGPSGQAWDNIYVARIVQVTARRRLSACSSQPSCAACAPRAW